MEDTPASRIFSKLAAAIFVIALIDLIFVNWWIVGESQRVKVNSQSLDETEKQQGVGSPSPESLVLRSPSPSPIPATSPASGTTTVVEKQTNTVVQNANKEVFISMGSGSASTSSYSDVNGTDVTVDTTKYSAIDSIVFEASIWVQDGNGRAYAQLYNVDDKNPYIESVISNNVSTPTVKSSGIIPFPSGKKTYRVLAKTDLEQFPAHVSNARIKITLK